MLYSNKKCEIVAILNRNEMPISLGDYIIKPTLAKLENMTTIFFFSFKMAIFSPNCLGLPRHGQCQLTHPYFEVLRPNDAIIEICHNNSRTMSKFGCVHAI